MVACFLISQKVSLKQILTYVRCFLRCRQESALIISLQPCCTPRPSVQLFASAMEASLGSTHSPDSPDSLDSLADDSLLLIARFDIGSGLALRSTCSSMHTRLHSFGKEATMRRQAEAGRSAAELSLVNMKGKSEVDLAADRAIARLTAAGIAPPVPGARGAPVVPLGGAAAAAANATASATCTAALGAGAQASGWFVPSPVPRAAVPAEPAVPEPLPEPLEAPRRRRTLSGLISKLLVKSVIR